MPAAFTLTPRRILQLAGALSLGFASLPAAPDDAGDQIKPPFTAKEMAQGYTDTSLLVLPKAQVAAADLTATETTIGLVAKRVLKHVDNARLLTVPAGLSVSEARQQLLASGLYEIVEYDHILQTAAEPTDPDFTNGAQWHHRNTGQSGGRIGADIGSVAAWDIRTSAANVIVAVIDSGVRLTHQDIAPNLWVNPNEIAGNNIDDDNNGFVDDVNGIDARDNDSNPNPQAGDNHGTHVAGIVGAAANNGVAGTGVAWDVQIMALRFIGSGGGTNADAVTCVDYAIAKGADVINASYGSSSFSSIEAQAIRRARDAGIIFVAAAGNEGVDLDDAPSFPANYFIDNVVSVANSTRLDDLSPGSNTGSGIVELAAPGSDILSLDVGSTTDTDLGTGTSMAAPMVSGAAALLRAQFPGDTYRETIHRLLRGTQAVTAFSGEVQTGGRLHVATALTVTETRPHNDDFADRSVLAGDAVQVRASTWNATTETGEPSHAGRLSRSIWFTWTPDAPGEVRIDSRNSLGDTTLAVYTGDNVANLSLVTSNDNESSGFLTSAVTFNANAGTPYHIALDSSATGIAVLRLSANAANDAFASAQTLSGDAPLVTTTNAEATSEPGEPQHATGANGRSLWYKWIAPQDQTVQVSAYSATLDPVVAIYTGSAVNALTLVAKNDDTGINGVNLNALAKFNATEDTTYYIALDNSGSSNGEITLTLTDAAWQYVTGSATDGNVTITNAPAVGPEGRIYFSSSDSYFYALNADGTLAWRTLTNGYSDSSGAAIDTDGSIYFGISGQPRVYALRSDGTVKWNQTFGTGSFVAAPAIGGDGTVYFKQTEGVLRALSPAGTELWSYTVSGGQGSYGGPAVGPDGTIYFPANDGAIHALNPTGSLRWKYQPQLSGGGDDTSEIYTSPALDADGNLYASTLSGTVFSLTPSGSERWVFHTPESGENVSSSISLGDGRAYFASYAGYLYALNQSDGTQVWRSSIEAQARSSSPAIAADGSIVVGSYSNKLFHFNSSGELIRTWSAGNWFRSSPTLANGRVYVGNGDGKLYTFALEDDVGPAPAGDTYPWPQYRHGPRNLGRATIETIGQVLTPNPSDPGRLVNLSVRNRTERGSGVLTAGFVLSGGSGKELVIRGIGPTLADYGVTGNVTATELKVFASSDTSTPLETNSGWTSATGDGRELGAFVLPDGSADSVVRRTFGPEPYTAQVLPATDNTDPGVALVEIYDAATSDLSTRLVNLSARTGLATNGDVTLGFVLDGATPRTVLIRAVGPGLSEFGVPGVLANPRVMLLNGQVPEFSNDDWGGSDRIIDTAKAVGAFPLQSSSADAALLTSLPPGAYTARVTAPAGQSGVVLLEVYLVE